jgi:2-oxoglutarate/2-oxoacid ferredoxin oxidoreductase subunit beta
MSRETVIPTENTQTIPLTRKDFVSDQEVRWCPGCGDYAILAQVQKVLPELGIPRENIVFISGIGCSSRFPYYMNTYGIHSIHGRAPTLASGLASANPELSIWVVTGDGDGLSIGGNHLLHTCRRNLNINILLFNNRIYGLTKGQYSPTSRQGARTKSSPLGTIEQPLNPLAVALSAEATFVARTMDANVKHLGEVLHAAAAHRGTAFVEIYQKCVIFNPLEWEPLSDRSLRDDNLLFLEHGRPLIFGKNRDKGIRLKDANAEVVQLGNGIGEEDLLVHDAHQPSSSLAYLLSRLDYPLYPVPMGIFRQVESPTYTDGLMGQIADARARHGPIDLNQLYRSADLWEVTAPSEVQSQMEGTVPPGLSDEYMDTLDQKLADPSPMQDRLNAALLSELEPKAPITIIGQTSLANAIRQMNSHNIGCLLVTDEKGRLAGIFTERDVLMQVAGLVEDLAAAVVADYMTPDPVALKSDTPIKHALHLMSVHGFRHVPLVNEHYQPEGIISFRDVVRYLRLNLTDLEELSGLRHP